MCFTKTFIFESGEAWKRFKLVLDDINGVYEAGMNNTVYYVKIKGQSHKV
jgi:hypothetical protein